MKKYLLIFILLVCGAVRGQEIPENFKFNSMITFNDFPAGNVTGTPDISLPLYASKTAGDLTLNLSLQYNLQGGINSNILGSQFGDSWNLSMSGIISREVKGKFQPVVSDGSVETTTYFDFDENYYNRNAGATGRGISSDRYDFDVMGLRGKFIIKKSGSSYVAEVIESNDYLKINVFRSGADLIDKIEIRDKKGMLYTFTYQSDVCPNIFQTKKKVTERENPLIPFPDELPGGYVMHPSFDRTLEGGPNNYYSRLETGPAFWKQLMLTQVSDKNGKLLLDITYDEPKVSISDPSTGWINGISNYSSVGKAYVKEIKIVNIGSVYFNNLISTTNNRNFLYSYAQSMQVKDLKGTIVKEFEFSYSTIDKVFKRITGPSGSYINYFFKKSNLSYIKEYNSSKTQSNNTSISYNGTFGNEINDYGYYHNATTKATATGGSIQKIKYPTGGSVLYQFESHDYFSPYNNATLKGRGLRLKRTAYFTTDQAESLLYTTPTITNAEQLIDYEYKDHTDVNKSSGKVRNDLNYFTGNWSDEQNALLYQKVKVLKTGIGYKEFFYKNTPDNSSVNNSNYNFYRRQLEESRTFDAGGALLDKGLYTYQYAFLNDAFNTDSYNIEPYAISEEQVNSMYEGSQNYSETKNIQYNGSYRQPGSITTTDNLGTVNKTEFDYNLLNNTVVNTYTRNYINGGLTDQTFNTYGSLADFIKTEFKTPEMSTFEKVGNESSKYINGLLMGYIQPDGIPVTLVYGYLGTQVVAKLVNVDANVFYSGNYQNFLNNVDAYSTQYLATYNEDNLKTTLNSLRTTFPNALITTYTYRPMIGVSGITDENGKTTTYEYDVFNRLSTVKDHSGNILKEYKYNFTN